jgi:histidinol-phosphate aminotransferase
MRQFNRRHWLRLTGIAGSAALVQPLSATPTTIHEINVKPPSIARLSSNENPFGPSERVRKAVIEGFDEACRYPFGAVAKLSKKIAAKEGVSPEHIIITGGSMEGLKATGLTYGMDSGEIISPFPTFLSLVNYAKQFGAFVNRVPLNNDLEHDLDEMERRVTNRTSLVFVCNPNNPTGTIISKEKIGSFCDSLSKRCIVFSDEAYYDFITEPDYPSMVSLVKKGGNVVVSRTFSKVYGLAGFRIGYLIARPDIAARIKPNVMANTNMLAIYAATAAMEDPEFYDFSLQKNLEAKTYIYDLLDELGLRYVKSHANFVFFHTGRPIAYLVKEMKKHDVHIGRPFPPLTDWCRISTGRMEDVSKFGSALKKLFA